MALVDIYARHANGGFAWIPKPIDKKGPLLNYDATLEEVYELLTIYPQVWIYDSATKKVITLSNLSKYFPDYDPGGGSGGVTPEQLATALQGKVDKVAGKDLSTNDYTTEEKTKLAGIPEIDTTPTEDSTNLITSGGVYTALQSAGGDNFSVIKKTRTGSGSDVIASGEAKTFSFSIPTMEIAYRNIIGIVGAISRTEGIIVAGASLDGRGGLGTSSEFSFTLYNAKDTSTTIWTADIYILTKS